ncbi:unnamed protein product [Prorocentrum cordatum]|uniref:Uncharacterized protein n=1 Tax=Prorocentrum cordatum TaxID=2364126 RepID=A0ABN9XR35_9DINO|nr:unnamed protein product [Polarella glacialis]
MFAPIAEAGKKRSADGGGPTGPSPEEDVGAAVVPADIRRFQREMAKLLMHHEDFCRSGSRDDNFVLSLVTGAPIQVALDNGAKDYGKTGKEAREAAPDLASYKGHPKGKRPDCFLRMVLFRMGEACEAKLERVRVAIQQGEDPAAALEALKVLQTYAGRVQDPAFHFISTRCFHVQATEGEEGEEKEVTKWIFACNHHPDLRGALHTLRVNGGLSGANLVLTYDQAPRCKQAKLVEKLAFKSQGGASGLAGAAGRPKKPKKA